MLCSSLRLCFFVELDVSLCLSLLSLWFFSLSLCFSFSLCSPPDTLSTTLPTPVVRFLVSQSQESDIPLERSLSAEKQSAVSLRRRQLGDAQRSHCNNNKSRVEK